MELGTFRFVSFRAPDIARNLGGADDAPAASLTGETVSEMSMHLPLLALPHGLDFHRLARRESSSSDLLFFGAPVQGNNQA